jgi:hypothetical protein
VFSFGLLLDLVKCLLCSPFGLAQCLFWSSSLFSRVFSSSQAFLGQVFSSSRAFLGQVFSSSREFFGLVFSSSQVFFGQVFNLSTGLFGQVALPQRILSLPSFQHVSRNPGHISPVDGRFRLSNPPYLFVNEPSTAITPCPSP